MVKVWDYEANKTLPFYFQAFIGHTYAVKSLMFCPLDNGLVLSAGEKDGIYLWNFYGDIKTSYAHSALEDLTSQKVNSEKESIGTKGQSVLERLRTTRKENKQNLALQQDAIILPSFKPLNPVDMHD